MANDSRDMLTLSMSKNNIPYSMYVFNYKWKFLSIQKCESRFFKPRRTLPWKIYNADKILKIYKEKEIYEEKMKINLILVHN